MFRGQELGLSHDAAAANPASLNPRKRKRSADYDCEQLLESFSVLDESAHVTLHPHCILARRSLPLAYFDLCCDTKHPRLCGQIFTSEIPCLKVLIDQDASNGPSMLIAGTDDSLQLYGVENIAVDTYSLVRFAPWLSLHSLRTVDGGSTNPYSTPSCHSAEPSASHQWWKRIVVESSTLEELGASFSPAPLIAEAPEVAPAYRPEDQCSLSDSHLSNLPQSDTVQKQLVDEFDCNHSQQSPADQEEIFSLASVASAMVMQYLEVLYLSKASLAYFPKGSLSRARALAGAADASGESPRQLASSMRDMVLSGSVFERKYKSKLPDLLKTALSNTASFSDGLGGTDLKAAHPKRLRRTKPGKDGTYSIEADYLMQWWQNDHATGRLPELTENSIRDKLATLRFRESLLQIIMVLEILAIETSGSFAGAPGSEAPDIETRPGQAPELGVNPQAVKKPKKPRDLNFILDTLVDRACILQSLESIDSAALQEGSVSESKRDNADASSGRRDDKLREFCVDILVPFYAPRLPKIVESLARRMGVSVKPSPRKPASAPTNRRRTGNVAPGSEIRRSALQRQRSSADPTAKPNQGTSESLLPPSLSRASTDTILLHDVKRERSSTPQDGILKTARTSFSRTNSVGGTKSFNSREVDLTALNKYRANKDRKKISVELELKEAIAVLRKPNRDVAAKEYVNETERRVPRPSRGKGPTKSKLAVEIGATPRKEGRVSNAGFDQPASLGVSNFAMQSSSKAISSTELVIPASVLRQHHEQRTRPPADILETPSRGPSKKINALQTQASVNRLPNIDDVVPQSTVKPAYVTKPTAKEAKATEDWTSASTENIRPPALVSGPQETPTKQTSQRSTSIYDVLGWDDDGDVDELL